MTVRIERRRWVSAEGVGDVWDDVSLIFWHLVLCPTMHTGLVFLPWSPLVAWASVISGALDQRISAPATCQSMSQIVTYEVSMIYATRHTRDWEDALVAKFTYATSHGQGTP